MTADVNTEFDRQRAGQIAAIQAARADYQARIADFESGAAQAALDKMISDRVDAGEIAMMGDGAYRVLTGWDRGEVFRTVTARQPGELMLIEPQSGLDTNEAGQAMGYFAEPEWHGLGTIIPGGTTDIARVLELSGLDFHVDKRPVRYFDDAGDLQVVPGQFVTTRSDRKAGHLGVVGSRYTPVQNADAFDFLAELLGQAELLPVSAFGLRGGRQCVIGLRLPVDVEIDSDGIADIVIPYVMASNSHDGRTPFQCVVTPWRPRCSNTERLALSGALTKWSVPHFRNALQKINAARNALRLTVKYYDTFAVEETTLARTALTTTAIDSLIAEFDELLWPDKTTDQTEGKGERSKRAETTRTGRNAAIRDILSVETERVGQTAYAVERAYTDYLDHVAPHRIAGTPNGAAVATAIVEGAEDARKGQVHQRLMLVNR